MAKNKLSILIGWVLCVLFVPCATQGQVNDTIVIRKQVVDLIDTAKFFWLSGHPETALPYALKAKELSEGGLGLNYWTAVSMHRLAAIYAQLTENEKAESLYKETIDLWGKIGRQEDIQCLKSKNNLAKLYIDTGDFNKAESGYSECITIWEKSKGNREDLFYIMLFQGLGNAYQNKGKYDEADSLFLKVQLFLESLPNGKAHYYYGLNLSSQGNNYLLKGEYENALVVLKSAISIFEKLNLNESSDYRICIQQQALAYYYEGELSQADSLFSATKNNWEKFPNYENQYYAACLFYLGSIRLENNDYINAEKLLSRSKSLLEKLQYQNHIYYASVLSTLGTLYTLQRKYENVDTLFKSAISILEKAMGKDHPFYLLANFSLAKYYDAKGDYTLAAELLQSIMLADQKLLQKAFKYSSEQEMLQYTEKFADQTSYFFGFLQAHPSDSLLKVAYNNVLLQKNTLLEAAAARERAILKTDSTTQVVFVQWKSSQSKLNKEFEKPIALRDNALIIKLLNKIDLLDKELKKRSWAFGESQTIINWQQVRDSLAPNQVVIEFITYPKSNLKTNTDTLLYAALILEHGCTAPAFVYLCKQKQLEKLLENPPTDSQDELWKNYIQKVYAKPSLGKESLYDLIWKPLESYFAHSNAFTSKNNSGSRDTIFFAADGLLYQINLNAIRDAEGEDINQRYQLTQLGSTRAIAVHAQNSNGEKSIALFGGITYDVQDDKKILEGEIGVNKKWTTIKHSKEEVDNVASLFSSKRYSIEKFTEYAATEAAVKDLGIRQKGSPTILLFSTHGFFLPVTRTKIRYNMFQGGQLFHFDDDPMRRGGLVFSGANQLWSSDQASNPNQENGILTAAEIKTLNLSNTEMVVLSACNTGQGEVIGSEGVYGLQRAFKIAGVKYVIMSLWSVSDQATQVFMTSFFENLLKGMDAPKSFHLAQERVKLKFKSVFYWGGFVLLE